MKKTYIIGIGVAVILLGGGYAAYRLAVPSVPSYEIKMENGETISSWNFKNIYTGNPELEARAATEIKRLNGLFGTKKFTDYELYVSVANQYDLLGDGKNELAYLEKAIAVGTAVDGLAWNNAGNLFKKLGAYATARASFEKAVLAEPIPPYREALLDFLKEKYPNDTAAISEQEKLLGR